MHSPSLQLHLVSQTHYCVSGDVTIHEGAAIAPGVLLQADPDSRIVIGVGVCLGIGAVIHASGGAIEIGDGASLGAGVLVVGAGRIGERACIGATTTLFNQSVAPNAMIAPGSLLAAETIPAEPEPTSVEPEATPEAIPAPQPELPKPSTPQEELPEESDEIDLPIASEAAAKNGSVYGQAYVNQMLGRLFPHQQNPDGSSNS